MADGLRTGEACKTNCGKPYMSTGMVAALELLRDAPPFGVTLHWATARALVARGCCITSDISMRSRITPVGRAALAARKVQS